MKRKNSMEALNMEALELIKEEIFPVAKKPWIKKIFNDIPDDYTVKCIYAEINGEISIVSATAMAGPFPLTPEEEKSMGNDFTSYIRKHRPSNFKDLLLLLTLYPVDLEGEIKRHKPLESSIGDVIEALLGESKGILLWNYQMENILSLFINDRDEILAVRKGINAKKPDAFSMARKMWIDRETTLEDLIINRTLGGYKCTRDPDLQGALELYRILGQHKGEYSSMYKILHGNTPISEWKADIHRLARYFIDKACEKYRKPRRGISRQAMDVLIQYPWPRGTLEMECLIANLVILTSGEKIKQNDLPKKLFKLEASG